MLIGGVATAIATIVFTMASLSDYEVALTRSLLNSRPHLRICCPEEPEANIERRFREVTLLPDVESSCIGYRISGAFRFTVLDSESKEVTFSDVIQTEIVGYSFRPQQPLAIDLKDILSEPCRNRKGMDPLLIMAEYNTKDRMLLDEQLSRQLFGIPLPSGDNVDVVLTNAAGEAVSKHFTTAGSYLPAVIGIAENSDHCIYVRKEEIQPSDSSGNRLGNCVDIRLRQPRSVQAVILKVRSIAGNNTRIEAWSERDSDKLAFISLLKASIFIATTLLLGMAAFGVYFIVSMIVEDKYRQIATLRALGASTLSIRCMFLNCGLVVATAGVCLGMPFGWVAAAIFSERQTELMQSFVSTQRSSCHLPLFGMLCTCCMAYLFCLCASWIPCRRAFMIEPASLMRSE